MLPSVCSASSVYIPPAGHGSLLPYPPTITPSSIVDNPRADSAPPVSSATVEIPPAVLSLSLFVLSFSSLLLSFFPSFLPSSLPSSSFFSRSYRSSPFLLFLLHHLFSSSFLLFSSSSSFFFYPFCLAVFDAPLSSLAPSYSSSRSTERPPSF